MELLQDTPNETDRLGFNSMAEVLSEVILETASPFTIGIFGEWGCGKTTLMQMLDRKLHYRRVETVWFNAWRYEGKDVIWNALIQSIFFRMKCRAEERGDTELLSRIKEAASNLAWLAARKFSSSISGGSLKADDVKEIQTAIQPLNAGKLDADKFDFINKFEQKFAELVEELLGDRYERLVIFVDDLDRCLPENAVEVLEAIKLYLDTANVTFVVGVEPEVIRDGIKLRYEGNKSLQEKEYLEKIIQLPFVMKGLHPDAVNSLINYKKTASYQGDKLIKKMIILGTQSNPRRIKRFINTFHVMELLEHEKGYNLNPDDVRRLAFVLLAQIRFNEIYAYLVKNPNLIAEYLNFRSQSDDLNSKISDRPDLKLIFESSEARQFFDLSGEFECSEAHLGKWILLSSTS